MTLCDSKMDDVNNIDIRLETPSSIYLIQVKSSLRKAIQDAPKIKKTVCEITLSGKADKEIIPVCVINGIGDTVDYLEEMEVNSSPDGIRDLVGISEINPRFRIWDINGKNVLGDLEKVTTPAIFRVAWGLF